MKNLQLSLKRNWFKMTKQQIKHEDYREITPYWCNRLALLNGEKLSKWRWRGYLISSGKLYMELCSEPNSPINPITFQKFDSNIMTDGYPKSTDSERILKLEHKGIEIREGNPEWGAIKGVKYLVIKHGKKLFESLTIKIVHYTKRFVFL